MFYFMEFLSSIAWDLNQDRLSANPNLALNINIHFPIFPENTHLDLTRGGRGWSKAEFLCFGNPLRKDP
jgi:hypothetical protein